MSADVFSSAASKIAALSAILHRNLKSTRSVDFEAESHLQDAVENLHQILCALWENFESDEETQSWHRCPPQNLNP